MAVVLFTIRDKQDETFSVAADSPQIRLLSSSVRLLGFTLTLHKTFIVWNIMPAIKRGCCDQRLWRKGFLMSITGLYIIKVVSKAFVTDLAKQRADICSLITFINSFLPLIIFPRSWTVAPLWLTQALFLLSKTDASFGRFSLDLQM